MKVGLLGAGEVGKTLAAGLLQHGHDVVIGTRDPGRLREWLKQHPRSSAGSFADAANFADLVILAVKGSVASRALRLAGTSHLVGKIIIDACNPLADQAPVNGVPRLFTSLDDSLMERLQREFAAARFVKAFSCVAASLMVHPGFASGPPTMFICGNDAPAKRVVGQLLAELGWEAADLGQVESARAIEPLCMLWGLQAPSRLQALRLLSR